MKLRNRLFILFSAMVIALAAVSFSHAVDVPQRPANYVVDLADIIESPVEGNLNLYLKELERKTSAQFIILTIQSLEGGSIDDFALEVAHDKWKLGQEGKDNGVLLVVSTGDKKYRIEVGYGLEGPLPDSLVGSIGRDRLVPFFRKGEFSQGIYAAALVIAGEIAKEAGVEISGMPRTQAPVGNVQKRKRGKFDSIISIIVLVFMVILFIRNPRLFLMLLLFSSMGGRRGSWGGGGGGGFGGGGGGGFGGGGASGGW
jgi:uncharacterized protein